MSARQIDGTATANSSHDSFIQVQGDRLMGVSAIRPEMEVVGRYGDHVGTVAGVDGCEIKLARNHRRAGGQCPWIPLQWVAEVNGKVKLDRDSDQARHEWYAVPSVV